MHRNIQNLVQDVIFPAIKINCKRLYNESFSAAALNFKPRIYRGILVYLVLSNLNLLYVKIEQVFRRL